AGVAACVPLGRRGVECLPRRRQLAEWPQAQRRPLIGRRRPPGDLEVLGTVRHPYEARRSRSGPAQLGVAIALDRVPAEVELALVAAVGAQLGARLRRLGAIEVVVRSRRRELAPGGEDERLEIARPGAKAPAQAQRRSEVGEVPRPGA